MTRFINPRLSCLIAAVIVATWSSSSAWAALSVSASAGAPDPEPVCLGEESVADLSATADDIPTPGSGCTLNGPEWSVGDEVVEYRATSTEAWGSSPGDESVTVVQGSTSSADAELKATFATAGYYKITVKSSVHYDDGSCGGDWNAEDTVAVEFTAVGIEKIIEDGSMPEDEGPLYTVVTEDITVRAKPDPSDASFPANQPTWKVITKPVGSGVGDPAAGETAKITPDETGEYELEASCGTSNKKIKIFAIKVVFKEDATQKYGFDSFTNATEPWKSVEKTKKDKATAEITPAAAAPGTFFTSSNVAKMKITPANAAGSPQTVEVEGIAKGEAVAEARAGKATGPIAGKMNVWVRAKKTETLGVRLIHCEKDDIQVIPKGKGKPNTVCITAAAMMALQTTAAMLMGDDTIDGSTVTTGPDGICQTTAAMGDTQVIAVGKGKAGEVCVHHGVNNKRDTKEAGDDVVAGEDIKTGPNGICNTDAASTNINSTDVGAAAITSYLNSTVYNQAVFEFQVTKLATKTVRFDLNQDGQVDVNSGWMSAEMTAIRDAGDDPAFDRIIFLVDNPNDGSLGYMAFSQKYGFVHADQGNATNTVAHELGHGAFGLAHTPGDGENLMHPTNANPWRLRKGQWDTINP